jgi:hypothetical protein
MTTLSDILQQASIDLGITEIFAATGGSVTTTVNSDFANWTDPPDEEYFKNQYIFVRHDAAGVAPQGEWAKITGYVPATWTLTHGTVSAAVAVGDEILLAKQNNFPLLELIMAVNDGLSYLGTFTFKDESLTTIASTTEYALPSGVVEVLGVDIGNTTDGFTPVASNVLAPTSSSLTGAKLVLPEWSAGETIRILYNGEHPHLTVFSSVLYPFISLKLAVSATKMSLLEGYINSKSGQAKPHWMNVHAMCKQQVDEGRVLLPTVRVKKKSPQGLKWPAIED